MVTNTYCWLLAILKSAYSRNNLQITIRKYNSKIIKLLDILLDVGYISSYYVKDNQIHIYLCYVNGKPTWENLSICFSRSSDRIISRKILNGYLFNDKKSVFILSTNRGLMTTLSSNFIGGKLVCILS